MKCEEVERYEIECEREVKKKQQNRVRAMGRKSKSCS